MDDSDIVDLTVISRANSSRDSNIITITDSDDDLPLPVPAKRSLSRQSNTLKSRKESNSMDELTVIDVDSGKGPSTSRTRKTKLGLNKRVTPVTKRTAAVRNKNQSNGENDSDLIVVHDKTDSIRVLDRKTEAVAIAPKRRSAKRVITVNDDEEEPCASNCKKMKVGLSVAASEVSKVPRGPKGTTTRTKRLKKIEPTKVATSQDDDVEDEDVNICEKKSKKQELAAMEWDEVQYVAQSHNVSVHVVKNVTKLLDQDCTIPFIARYRKELTNDMPPEKLREICDSYEMAKTIRHKASTVLHNIAQQGKLSPELERTIRCARSVDEIEYFYAPFKAGSKGTLAERARKLGLEEEALALLDGTRVVAPEPLVSSQPGRSTSMEVLTALQHIIADLMSKDRLVLDFVRQELANANVFLETSKARASKVSESKKLPNHQVRGELHCAKFERYFGFSSPVRLIRPHQVLAINRGEKLKVLAVKVVFPKHMVPRFQAFCEERWMKTGQMYPQRTMLLQVSAQDSFNRLIQPLLTRQVRGDLTRVAHRAGVEVFATNLKKLLLMPPLRGRTVLGVDPGFRNGCKLALVSHTGDVLHTDVIFPHSHPQTAPASDADAVKLKTILTDYGCELLALGNGTACRETETYLSGLIQSEWFRPLDVQYTIVSEQGVSIYSCSTLAKKEFPIMDPTLISAVSLARRVQDPLGELVKVEPRHLGVGMYQHDLPDKHLNGTLDQVVVECVSFVGVDVNTASQTILRHVAGLSERKAESIVQWRATRGFFTNRQQLKLVKGIGNKTFEQCAGFIRVRPETVQGRDRKMAQAKRRTEFVDLSEEVGPNPLDQTWIHPESYSVAHRFIIKCGVQLQDLGRPHFCEQVRRKVAEIGLSNLAQELGCPEPLVHLISEGLQQDPDADLRSQYQGQLFRRGLTSIEDLAPGMVLTGRVANVTHFGSFVDVGVGHDGLIPLSGARGMTPQLGDRVEVEVRSVELQRRRISLVLLKIMV